MLDLHSNRWFASFSDTRFGTNLLNAFKLPVAHLTHYVCLGSLYCLSMSWSLTAQANTVQTGESLIKYFVGITMLEHPTIIARIAELNAANLRIKSAKQQYWPTPSLNVSDNITQTGGFLNARLITAKLKLPLWTGGRISAGVDSAEAQQQIANAALLETRNALILEIVLYYGEAYAAQVKIDAYQANVDTHIELYEQIVRRTEAGLSARGDVSLALSRLETAKAELTIAKAEFDAAKVKLEVLVNQQAPDVLPDFKLHKALPSSLDKSIDLALTEDPNLLRINAEVEQFKAQAKQVDAALWPDLYATVSKTHGDKTGEGDTKVELTFESNWGAGLSSISGRDLYIQQSQAKLSEANYQKRNVTQQIRADYSLKKAASGRRLTLEKALGSAESVASSWSRQFIAGRKTWIEVMNAAREVAQIRVLLADAISSELVTHWRLAIRVYGFDWLLSKETP